MTSFKKPRVLKRKNIKRRTGAKAQSTQIMALTKQVSSMTKENYERIRTSWRMLRKPLGYATSATATSFICPIPYVMCDPLGTAPTAANKYWADNNMPIPVPGQTVQTFYQKRLVFGYSDQAANTNRIYHTGASLRYQLETNEPSYSKINLFLIKCKKKQADQLTIDRQLNGTAAGSFPGSGGNLALDVDYTTYAPSAPAGIPATNETIFGAELNSKYYTVLWKRECCLSHPNGTSIEQTVRTSNTNPANNAVVCSGKIKIPGQGVIKNVSRLTQQTDNKSAPAMESSLLDQRNEDCLYLVAIHNDATSDGQSVKLSLVCTDYYNAVV